MMSSGRKLCSRRMLGRLARGSAKACVSLAWVGVILLFWSLGFLPGCKDEKKSNDEPIVVTRVKPEAGSEVWGWVRLEVTADAPARVAHVSFYLDAVEEGALLGSVEGASGSPYALAWHAASTTNGSHTIHVVLEDSRDATFLYSWDLVVANRSRQEAIPGDAVKMTPATDLHPPSLASAFQATWEDPVPLEGPINTAGAEDSPFVTPDGNELYFWFTPDMSVLPQVTLTDRVTGIYRSVLEDGAWSEPERVWLAYYDELALDGAETIYGDQMFFASARVGGYREMDMYVARREGDLWVAWENLGQVLNEEHEVGELHVVSGGDRIYFDSRRAGGLGEKDIWVVERVGESWLPPEPLEVVNTEEEEGWPYVNEDETELWFTRIHGAPEIHRSLRVGGVWQEPELVLSSLAGEVSLDRDGNLYFVHHFWDDASQKLLEADIYFCRRRP